MKGLLKIVGIGLVVFLLLAIADEWQLFSSAWFGGADDPPAELSAAEQKSASDAVHQTLTLMRHLYLSGGDARFSDRMPAAAAVIEEMLDDIRYLGERHLMQDPDLQQLDILSIEVQGDDLVEIRTRELWIFRVLDATAGGDVEPPLRRLLHGRYLVHHGGTGWEVGGWALTDPGADS